jgi:nucleotide-binding universal stress UspA family protein
MFKTILLPTDGSDVALAATDRAIALARLAGAALHAVYVQEPYPYTGIGATNSAGVQEYLTAAQQEGVQALDGVTARTRAAGVTSTTEIAEGSSPAEQIVETARRCGADLIVMGSHGRTGVARVLLGSVAGKVLVLSPVPVMIVK